MKKDTKGNLLNIIKDIVEINTSKFIFIKTRRRQGKDSLVYRLSERYMTSKDITNNYVITADSRLLLDNYILDIEEYLIDYLYKDYRYSTYYDKQIRIGNNKLHIIDNDRSSLIGNHLDNNTGVVIINNADSIRGLLNEDINSLLKQSKKVYILYSNEEDNKCINLLKDLYKDNSDIIDITGINREIY